MVDAALKGRAHPKISSLSDTVLTCTWLRFLYKVPEGRLCGWQVKEAKGLDMVRRDWCGLAKDCGNFALDQILSGQPCEEVVDAIHAKLQEVGLC